MASDDDTYWLNRNELLFNLTLLSAVFAAVAGWANGTTIGQAFGIALGVVFLVMPLILSACFLILRLFRKQSNHTAAANALMLIVLVALIGLTVRSFGT